MSKKQFKKIGIVAWSTGDNSFGVTKPYLEFFSSFGTVIMITPQQTDIIEDLDLLVLPGGRDVNTIRYGETPGYWTGHPDIYLEHFDCKVLPKYIENKTPIFGICRGLQTLNVIFGGTLKQHLYMHPHSRDDRESKVHLVDIYPKVLSGNTKCFKTTSDLFDKDLFGKFRTNSLHHQAIKDLGKGLSVLAITRSYGNEIEAIVHNEYPIAAVQYHPEHLYDPLSYNLITQLLTPIIKNK